MRVLLAENNLSNSLVATSILRREMHDVTVATNGAEAITRIQSEPYDVVLMDIIMPVMDGFETLQYLNSSSCRPDFVFALSSYDTDADVRAYRKAGFDGLIAKPLRPGDLRAAMNPRGSNPYVTTVGYAANAQDAESRPLLDEAIIRDGPGLADDLTRQRIWRTYRKGLSESLKQISVSLPGYVAQDRVARRNFREALHGLRSSSLTVGMNRAPYLARQLRDAPDDQMIDRVTQLLQTIRSTLPILETVMVDLGQSSTASREGRPGV